MTLAEIFGLQKARKPDEVRDVDLERLVRLANEGGSGADLSKMSVEERRKHLFKH